MNSTPARCPWKSKTPAAKISASETQTALRAAASFTESFLLLLKAPRSIASATRTAALNAIHGSSGESSISAINGQRLFPFHGVANVEKDLEVQLLATISEVERGHLGLVARSLGAFECLAIHVVEVGENSVAGS